MKGKFFKFGSRFNVSHCKNSFYQCLSNVRQKHLRTIIHLGYGKQQNVNESVAKGQHNFESWTRIRELRVQFPGQYVDVYQVSFEIGKIL